MKTLVFVSVCLLLATLAVFYLKPERETPPAKEAQPVECVTFRNATAAGFVDLSVAVHRTSGGSFTASAGGREQASSGFDDGGVWFWMRSYDPAHYYFCGRDDADEVGLSPALRPLFLRCVCGAEFAWNDYPPEGTAILSDGSYRVEISFSGGRPASQRYILDGETELALEFLEHQTCAGRSFPKRLRLSAHGSQPLEIEMGRAEVNPSNWPVAKPPQRASGVRLQP